jgi:mannose-6-phosphate isomerase
MSGVSHSFPPFLRVLPNRVRRNYGGGALLEKWCGEGDGRDGDEPEDWIASTTAAVNPGLPLREGEGLTCVELPVGSIAVLSDLCREEPVWFLGDAHIRNRGAELGFLAKLLDSAMRLHVQAHPTAEFARRHLGSRYGKFETYVILGFREGYRPTLRLGFQRAPSREEWKRIIEGQDIAAMDGCFDEIPLRVGEVWCVPGGMPHAIGEGVLMLEIMEPSDLVVRCEFERAGIVVPPEGRFMKRGLDFCLDIFDYRSRSVEEIQTSCRLTPKPTGTEGEEELIGADRTDCFVVRRHRICEPTVLERNSLEVLLVAEGRGLLTGGEQEARLEPSSRIIVPAGQNKVHVTPDAGQSLELLKIRPGQDFSS